MADIKSLGTSADEGINLDAIAPVELIVSRNSYV